MVRVLTSHYLVIRGPDAADHVAAAKLSFRPVGASTNVMLRKVNTNPDETLREAYVPRLKAYREAFPEATETGFDVDTRSTRPARGLGEAVDNLRKALSQVQDVLAAVEEAHEAAPIPTPGA